MREALVLVFALVAAGCVTAPAALTPAVESPAHGVDDLIHDLGKILELAIPVEGNVNLHGTVYLPDVEEGVKVPVVIDMGPYYGNLNAETSTYSEKHPPNLLYEHFLRRGYAIALVSVRGTGQSGGCFMVGGPQERADAAAAVEWLAAQPWSNGNVGMSGVSYDGTTPWEAYVSGAAPSLKAIIPVASITDFYRYSFFEGVPIGGGAAFNTYYLAEVDVAYTGSLTNGNPQNVRNVPPWVAVQPSNLCPDQANVYLTPYRTYMDGVHGPYWDERDMSTMLDQGTAAVFVVHGLKDFNVKMDHVQTVWDKLPGPKRMLLGQWAHNIPWRNTFDRDMSWAAYNATMDRFLDAYLKDDAAALAAEQAAPPVLVQDSANKTWALSAWPPVESVEEPWALAPGNGLAPGTAEAGEVRMRASPVAQAAGFTPLGRTVRSDAVEFATEPFAEDALFMGNPRVELNVSVDRPEGQFAVHLFEEEADGKRVRISAGWQNLAVRTSRDNAESVPTNEPLAVRVLMEALAQKVEKGNRLVLVLIPDNPDTLTPKVQATTFTVKLGGEDGARLILPRFPLEG